MKNYVIQKGVFYLFFPLFALFILYGCQKNYENVSDEYKIISNKEKEMIVDWIKEQKQLSKDNYRSGIDSLLYLSDWDKSIILETGKNNYKVIYVPQKNKRIALSLYYDAGKVKIDSGNLVFVNAKNSVNKIKGVLAYFNRDNKESKSGDFTGTITNYSIIQKFKNDFGFENGKVSWVGFQAARQKKGAGQSPSSDSPVTDNIINGCEWWGHYTLWSSGIVTLDYVYLKCFCEEQTTSLPIGGGQYLQIDCGGNGGSPSTSQAPPETEEILAFELNYRSQMSTEEIEIFESMSRVNQLYYLYNARTAFDRAAQLFPNSTYNGVGDAYRHAYFSALNVRSLGYEMAKRLGDAHELKPPRHPLEREMDLRNNHIGRELGRTLAQMYPQFSGDPHYFFMELSTNLDALIASGGLWRLTPLASNGTVIDGVTQLVRTN